MTAQTIGSPAPCTGDAERMLRAQLATESPQTAAV